MKCPNCGNDIQDGNLICEKCGYEVRIVPDYDPNTDVDIDQGAISDNNPLEYDDRDSGLDDTISDNTFDLRAIRTRAFITIGIVVLTLLAAIGVVFLILHTSSLDYQLNKIKNKASAGKYDEAIAGIENLYVRNSQESELLFLEADYYLAQNKQEMAIDTLKRMLSSKEYSEEDRKQVYDRLIACYSMTEDYNSIASLLDECEYGDIVTSYQNYLAMPPTFSTNGGQYTDVLRLKISANTAGTIYYTLDGSVPNKTSNVYSGMLVLETGTYRVSAMFVNQYGIESEIVSNDYDILVSVPDAPVVNLDTGNYDKPQMIEVEIPDNMTVYYTTDKSSPTIDSVPYTGPIPMPLNTSNFNFVAINEQGLSSDVVIRSYKLSFPNGLSASAAAETLKQRMIERGMLTDNLGHSERAPGTYSYSATSAVHIEGQGDYYIVREFYHDNEGNVTTSDTTYIVEIYQGSTGILGGDAINGFIALSF